MWHSSCWWVGIDVALDCFKQARKGTKQPLLPPSTILTGMPDTLQSGFCGWYREAGKRRSNTSGILFILVNSRGKYEEK